MRVFLCSLIISFGCFASSVIAQSAVVIEQSDDHNYGNYAGGCWKLSDMGFTNFGESIVSEKFLLQSVAFKRHREGGGATAGQLYLKVFEGDRGGLGNFVGVSKNKIDFGSLQEGELGTWTFDNLEIGKDTVYSYVVGPTNDSSNPSALVRMKISHPNDVLSSGYLLTGDDVNPGYDSDPFVYIFAQPAVILEQSDGHNYGNYEGGCWALSDMGFTGSGDPIASQSLFLQSVGFKRHREGSGATPGQLYLKVFEGNQGGLGTFVGISNNRLDFGGLQEGEVGTWTFDNLSLDKDTVYSYVVGPTNDSSNPSALLRMKMSHPYDVLSSGYLLAGDANPGYNADPFVQIVVTNELAVYHKEYSGIRPDDINGRKGLLNPERGFRWENRIGSFRPERYSSVWLGQINNRSDDGITMTQAYCELLDYCEMDTIPEDKLDQLRNDFAAVRASGVKLLLCFRYEMNVEDEKGPTLDVILSHIEQLKPILLENMDIIAVFQTGFIGLYGEWHRSYHGLDQDPEAQEQILNALLDIIPPDRKMVIRYPRHKNTYVMRVSDRKNLEPITLNEAHSTAPEARLGFCDHGFMVGYNDAGTFAPRPSVDYDYMTQESLFLPMDGEFFWAWNIPDGVKKDDGLEAIQRLWEHHYTLFSYAHNHTVYEGDWAKEELNARYSIDEWKEEPLNPEFLSTNNLPISDGYFEDAYGNSAERTTFEYIRDHLGYRLELQSSRCPQIAYPGKNFYATVEIVNRGFAAPVNPRPIYLVLVGENDVHIIAQADTDVRTWYPCDPINRTILAPKHTLEFKAKSFPNLSPGTYKMGIWMPDNRESLQNDAKYAIRFANRNVPWWTGLQGGYGVNIIIDQYEVVPESISIQVQGTVVLNDYNTSKIAGTPVTFEVLQNGAVVETRIAELAADGSYGFETSVKGDVEIRAKASHWLAQRKSVAVPGTVSFSLINGDITGDNRINVFDFAALKSNYNRVGVGDDPADLNGDGNINVFDYAILKKNYNTIGD